MLSAMIHLLKLDGHGQPLRRSPTLNNIEPSRKEDLEEEDFELFGDSQDVAERHRRDAAAVSSIESTLSPATMRCAVMGMDRPSISTMSATSINASWVAALNQSQNSASEHDSNVTESAFDLE